MFGAFGLSVRVGVSTMVLQHVCRVPCRRMSLLSAKNERRYLSPDLGRDEQLKGLNGVVAASRAARGDAAEITLILQGTEGLQDLAESGSPAALNAAIERMRSALR